MTDFVPKYTVDGIRKFHDELHSYPESPSRSDCMVCCCLLELARFEKDQADIQVQRDTWEDRETKYMLRVAHLKKGNRKSMRVYIAGPYTQGDVAINVRTAIEAADAVLKAGHIPYLPHLTHFWHMVCPGPYEQWIKLDLEWLPCCDAIIRLPGESSGADGEVAIARELGLPIYLGVDGFLLEKCSVCQ